MSKTYAVYVISSRRNGTLYTGVTGDLPGRIWLHRTSAVDGLTRKYGVHLPVWYEFHEDVLTAIAREKQIKGWNRE